jgi:hypothetical protein
MRARSDAGAGLRRLDLGLLREALSRPLRNDWDRGYAVYLLAVIGAALSMASQMAARYTKLA